MTEEGWREENGGLNGRHPSKGDILRGISGTEPDLSRAFVLKLSYSQSGEAIFPTPKMTLIYKIMRTYIYSALLSLMVA